MKGGPFALSLPWPDLALGDFRIVSEKWTDQCEDCSLNKKRSLLKRKTRRLKTSSGSGYSGILGGCSYLPKCEGGPMYLVWGALLGSPTDSGLKESLTTRFQSLAYIFRLRVDTYLSLVESVSDEVPLCNLVERAPILI